VLCGENLSFVLDSESSPQVAKSRFTERQGYRKPARQSIIGFTIPFANRCGEQSGLLFLRNTAELQIKKAGDRPQVPYAVLRFLHSLSLDFARDKLGRVFMGLKPVTPVFGLLLPAIIIYESKFN
jgi:hypothetical protein